MVVTASSPTHAPNFYSHRTFRPAKYDDPAIQVLLAEYLRELELRDDTLSDELGTAELSAAESYMEHGLRIVAYLIMSSPQYQLA